MRKYAEVFRISFKMQIVWRFDVAMTMVATFAHILTMWILWQAIFEGKEHIGGFTFGTMLSYYIVCSILRSIDFSNQISGEVSELIRGGGFSGHMVTPMNPMGFFISMVAGESAFHLFFSIISAILCVAIFRLNITLTSDITRILLAVAMILLGLTFMAGFRYFLGVLTFKFLEINFVLYLQMSMVAFATGAFVPLSLLPNAALTVFQFLPFSHVVYTPAMLLTGQIASIKGLFGLTVLFVWTAIITTIGQLTYNRLRKKYDGVRI